MSKLANIHYSAALAERNLDIKFVSIHPGIVDTNLTGPLLDNHNVIIAKVLGMVAKVVSVSPEKGVLNQLWAISSPVVKTGTYYVPVGIAGKGSELSQDRKLQEQLWNWTETELQAYLT